MEPKGSLPYFQEPANCPLWLWLWWWWWWRRPWWQQQQ